MTTEPISTRVNSALLPNFVGQTVRLACKTLKFQGDTALVQACDGGEITIQLLRDSQISDTYVEVIGSVVNASTIKMVACINLGSELDMKLVNDTVELIHDKRFYEKMFA